MNDVIERAKKYLDCVEALENAVGAYAGSNAMVAMNKLNASPEGLISELLTLVPEDKDEWQDISIDKLPYGLYREKNGGRRVFYHHKDLGQDEIHFVFLGEARERRWYTRQFEEEFEPITLPKQEQSKPNKE